MMIWITLLMGAMTLAAAPEEPILLPFSAGTDYPQVVTTDATVTPVLTDAGPALRVVTGHSEDWPGVTLPFSLDGVDSTLAAGRPADHWNLSRFFEVKVDIKNVGTNRLNVFCRVDTPETDGNHNSVTNAIWLEPGQSETLYVPLRRKPPAWNQVELFGMLGYPWGVMYSWEKPGADMLDPGHVTGVTLFVPKSAANHAFTIARVRASGAFVPPGNLEILKNPVAFFPLIDEFGQYIHRDWPGKTHSLKEMADRREREAEQLTQTPAPGGWDAFGGWQDGPQLEASGNFYTTKYKDKWWLVDPEGRLFFSHGIDVVQPGEDTPIEGRENWFKDLPDMTSEFQDCYSNARTVVLGHYRGTQPMCFDFIRANLIRKYGRDWSKTYGELAQRRLRSWGLNTIGTWSDPAIYLMKRTPYVVSLWFGGRFIEGSDGVWGAFHDVFDASFLTELHQRMHQQIGTTAEDPWCIGYFVDNELAWGRDGVSLAVATLNAPARQPAKQVFVTDLKAKYGRIANLNAVWGTRHASWEALLESTTPPDAIKAHADLAAFYRKLAQVYFSSCRQAVKEIAPRKLYLGCRFAWSNETANAMAAKYCDVVSFNLYRRDVTNFVFHTGEDPGDVPLIIGEFHFGALDRGPFHTGLVPVADQNARAQAYLDYIHSVLKHPQFVGCHWFKYMDEPTTGRPMDEENYQVGFLDICDTPYTETIQAAREIGETMYPLRLNGW